MSTIAAISTPEGLAGIGIVRISGKMAIDIADKIFISASETKLCESKGYRAHFGKVIYNQTTVDEAIALVFRAPHSYTGENVVEISCHGGEYVLRATLNAALDNGAKPAGAGEFTKRAFLNGKLKLTEAEAVMDIINADNKHASIAARASKEGALDKKINKIKTSLLDMSSHICAYIDYPEEDIPELQPNKLTNSLKSIREELYFLLKTFDSGKLIKHGINTVIIGKPNVGKSTLMNLLSGVERSIVTDVPGTTRDIIEEKISLGKVTLNLSDTAGIHNANNIVEKIGVEKAKEKIFSSQLILVLFDNSSKITDEDKQILDIIKDENAIAIINKSDLKSQIDIEFIKLKIKNIVKISAKTGNGLNKLQDIIDNITKDLNFDPYSAMLFNERQKKSVEQTLEIIDQALDAINCLITLDAINVLIEEAIGYLLELTGENVSEAVIDNVFSKFCIGK